MGKKSFLLVMILLVVCGPLAGFSAADELEKGIFKDIRDSRTVLVRMAAKQQNGLPVAAEAALLRSLAESIRASHLLMAERLHQRGEKMVRLGGKAAERQNAVTAAYEKAVSDYLTLIDSLSPEVAQEDIHNLKALLDSISPPKKRPLLGSLPYKHVGYPAREPVNSPAVIPAYRGGNRTVSPTDTAASAEAPISKEITELAQSLQWNPVLIYEWVKNNVETEWYWGGMKGAEETLHQKSGNDADQAALLVALLRASGFPARFVRGAIEFFPDMEKVKNLTGILAPLQMAALFQKAGIPFKPVIAGGAITNFQVEHIWVESEIPYANYRGAVIDNMGKSWLALDTSIKPQGYTRTTKLDIPPTVTDTVRDEYLQLLQDKTPLENLQSRVGEYLIANRPGKGWQDTLASRTLNPDILKIIPSSLQFRQIAITGEYAELPQELRHQVKFTATAGENELYSVTIETQKLSNRKIVLTYEPETVEDQNIIDSYGGLDNTPSYLVRLRPVLEVDGERLVVARDGLPMGADYTLGIDIKTPSGVETVNSSQISGNLAVIGIVGQKASAVSLIDQSDDAQGILYKEAISYIDRWNRAEDELAAFFKVALARPVPTVVIVGGVVDVTWLLDVPHGFEWKGVFIDAGYRRIETVSQTGDVAREREFIRLSALQGSILENRIFEDDLEVESISTAKLLQLAQAAGTAIMTIDKSSGDAIIPALPFDAAVKEDIANSVNQGLTVTIPASEVAYRDWSGIGYVKENPETGESGWMLSGMIAGGMISVRKEDWKRQDLLNPLKVPFGIKANEDPGAVRKIARITASDYQDGTAGKLLSQPLLALARDAGGRPVANVPVTFHINAGGGKLGADADSAVNAGLDDCRVLTGADGIAKAYLKLGEKTSASPYYLQLDRTYAIQIGQNLIEATAEVPGGSIALDKPFEANGFPGDAVKLSKVAAGVTDNKQGLPGLFAGSVWVQVSDEFDNPVSNKQVTFKVKPQEYRFTPPPVDTETIKIVNARLLPTVNSCPGSPSLDCPGIAEQLAVLSSINGSHAALVLGNTENTGYFIEATAFKDENGKETDVPLEPVTFTYSSLEIIAFDDGMAATKIIPNIVNHFDANGIRIDAGRAGKEFSKPLAVTLYRLEEATLPAVKENCSADCYYLKGSGVFETKRVDNGTVKFTPESGGGSVSQQVVPAVPSGQAASPVANGIYETRLTLGEQPGINSISIEGSATLPVKRINKSSGELYTTDATDTASTSLEIWGVLPRLVPDQWVLVNSKGYPTADVPLQFSVEPADYPVGSMTIRFYEGGLWQFMGEVVVQRDAGILSTGGAMFDPAKRHDAKLSLFSTEIESDPVNFNVVSVDLDIDSSNKSGIGVNGIHKDPLRTQEEEEIEEVSGLPGKLIPINDRDRDGNGIPGFAEGYDLQSSPPAVNGSAAFVPMILNIPAPVDLAKARIRFYYNASDPAKVDKGVYSPAPGGNIRLWTKDGGVVRKMASAAGGGDYINPGEVLSVDKLGAPLSGNPRAWRLYVEGVALSTQLGEELIRVDIDPDGIGPAPFMIADEVRATVNKAVLITDFNRDRKIDAADNALAAKDKIFYFWVNDDNDGSVSDDIPDGRYPDWEKKPGIDSYGEPTGETISKIDGIRDLEDFFPIFLDIATVINRFNPTSYRYLLKSADESLNFAFTDLTPAVAGDYLTNALAAENLGDSLTYQLNKDGILLNGHKGDPSFLDKIRDQGKGIILIEGRSVSTAPLELVVKDSTNGAIVFRSELKLSLAGVEQMFRHVTLTQSIDNDEAPAIETGDIGEHRAEGGEKTRYKAEDFTHKAHFEGFDAQLSDKYAVWIHGANVDGQDARAWHSEIFKRLFWAGNMAKFVGVSWFSYEGPAWGYYPNVVNAFATAAKLGPAIKGVTKTAPVTVMAHSLGNMLASSYLVDHHLILTEAERPNITDYMLLNAAVALEAYLGDYTSYAEGKEKLTQPFDNSRESSDMVHPAWFGYQKRFGASEWHQLFGAEDGRSKLTWRKRFADLPTGINYVSYFSKGEDVLASYAGESMQFISKLVHWDFQRNSWVLQEKWKGLPVGIAGSRHMGWGFNYLEDANKTPVVTNADGTESGGEFFTADQANISITDNKRLFTKPLFRKEVLSGEPFKDSVLNFENIIKPIYSELLAYALPALTTVTGGWNGDKMMEQRLDFTAIDMNKIKNDITWPRDSKNWNHSDIKDIALPFIFIVIEDIVNKGVLR